MSAQTPDQISLPVATPGIHGAARVWLRILLWVIGVFMAIVLWELISMWHDAELMGGGEMVDGIAMMIGLALIVFYIIVFIAGRIMLRRGSTRWSWFFVVLMLLLTFAPVVILGRMLMF